MDDRTPHTPTAADLVRYTLTLLLGVFALPESAAQLRDATLSWATAAELFRLYLPLASPHEAAAALAAMDAADALAAGRPEAAVARLAREDGVTPAAWLAAVSARRDAPTCERCALPVTMLPGPVGEALALADGAVRQGDAWVCADCLGAHPSLVAVYAGAVAANGSTTGNAATRAA